MAIAPFPLVMSSFLATRDLQSPAVPRRQEPTVPLYRPIPSAETVKTGHFPPQSPTMTPPLDRHLMTCRRRLLSVDVARVAVNFRKNWPLVENVCESRLCQLFCGHIFSHYGVHAGQVCTVCKLFSKIIQMFDPSRVENIAPGHGRCPCTDAKYSLSCLSRAGNQYKRSNVVISSRIPMA